MSPERPYVTSRGAFEAAERASVVSISYSDLILYNEDDDKRKSLQESLERGLGRDGLGIVSVTDVPGFQDLRKRLLPLAATLASMPKDIQKTWEDRESRYNVGWSCGKEWLGGADDSKRVRDTKKGSWYANPLHDVTTNDPTLLEKYPSYTRPNIWPRESVPELEMAFKDLGRLMYDIGIALLQACCASPYHDIARTASESTCAKGRLLCYMPHTSEEGEDLMWCGWHRDHGSLTALCPAYYMTSDPSTGEGRQLEDTEEIECSDRDSGLFVQTRRGNLVKVLLEKDALAFQVGEALEVLTGGKLQATPHCVVASREKNVTRCTFALFMQPHWDQVLDCENNDGEMCRAIEHWHPGISFGDFSKSKFAAYYE